MGNTIGDNTIGITSLAAGGYLGYKGIISGVRRGLGIRIEEHTTSAKNAKAIIKGGCILDPVLGGTGASHSKSIFASNSRNYVHITGCYNIDDMYKRILVNHSPKNKSSKELLSMILNNIYRKMQRSIYRNPDNSKNFWSTFTGKGTKTFFIGGTDNYFNTNFIKDMDDMALKTDKPLKVCRTKLGAMFSALKREGLSGILQNKYRTGAGILIALTLGYLSYKCIKYGLNKINS